MRGTVEFQTVTKAYDATVALAGFSVRFDSGRVHALMGRNGSGKSTAIKILAGAVQPTLGTLLVNDQPASFQSTADAFAAGIVAVYQELSLVPGLSVGENIFLGRLPKRAGRVDWHGLHQRANALLVELGLGFDSHRLVSQLSLGQQQMVEIAKAMSHHPSVLILDEPTSALASKEVESLFALIARLKGQGVTIIYITHRMNELAEIADTCTVLRDGHFIATVEMAETTPARIVDLMFGDVARAKRPPRRPRTQTEPLLTVSQASRSPAFHDVSFVVGAGEVLGIAGLLGAGRTELMRAVFGADRLDSGEILVNGVRVDRPSPERMKQLGLGYTPENRKEEGLIQSASIHANLVLASLRRIAPSGLAQKRTEWPFVERQIRDLRVKAPDPRLPVSTLSGGNQQKVVIGNWLNTDPKVMFFDEPTRGVDIAARQQIFEIIWQQADRGLGAVFVSSELEELLEVCDRILVMRQGRLVGQVTPDTTDLTQLYQMCMQGADNDHRN